ncbi:MAG: ABC transporter permease [Candidatus Nitrosoabyssus spongiisocia]|nr:MAG: ABC transporter permease [Nitrosopumilaceae archaeon AB1(1)]
MGFKRYIVKRMVTIFIILIITIFITVSLVGSSMDIILKQGIATNVRTEVVASVTSSSMSSDELDELINDNIQQRIKTLGLDNPWYSPQRLGESMYKILILDFGRSMFLTSDSGSSKVLDIIIEKLPRTILLFTTATIIIGIIGIFLGAYAANKTNSMIDKITSTFAVISTSFPVWWVGILLIFVFSFVYQIFPSRATPTVPVDDPYYIFNLLYHITLPVITIVLIGFGAWAYLVRNFMVGIMQEDYILSKKIIGIKKRDIIYKHALRNAAPPIITILALSLSGSLGGSIITEAVFDWPGMGRLYFDAITVLDLPIIVATTYVLTALFLVSILITDLLYGYFDPRIKTGVEE